MLKKLFPFVELTIESELRPDIIIDRLKQITYPYTTTKKDFEGKIKSTNFTLTPRFDYGPRSLLRPTLTGEIGTKDGTTKVRLRSDLSGNLRLLLVFGIVFNLGILVCLLLIILISKNNFSQFAVFLDLPQGFKWVHLWFLPIAHITFLYSGFRFSTMVLKTKVDKSILLLNAIFRG